jgi:hypothetical protein
MEDKMGDFIDQIGQIYNETYGNGRDRHQYSYFISGGCYVLAKIVKHYCPSAKIMHCIKDYQYCPSEEVINRIRNYFYDVKKFVFGMKKYDHAAIKYNNKLYDIFGEMPAELYDNFIEVTEEDTIAMENGFSTGESLGEGKMYNELIKQINECRFDSLINEINEEALEIAKSK